MFVEFSGRAASSASGVTAMAGVIPARRLPAIAGMTTARRSFFI